MDLYMSLNISDSQNKLQHYNALQLCKVSIHSVLQFMYCYAECHYTERLATTLKVVS
jgi:hypothetical protein